VDANQAVGLAAKALGRSTVARFVNRFERQYLAAQQGNPADRSVATEQPAALATTSAQPSGLTVAALSSQYLCYGDDLTNAQTIFLGNAYRIRFITDAPKFAIKTNGNGSAGTIPGSANFATVVDGFYLSKTPYNPNIGQRFGYTLFDFTGATTPRRFRDVVIETAAGLEFDGIFTGVTDTVYAPPRLEPKVVVIGDSYTGGTGAAFEGGSYPNLLGWRGGLDIWRDAFGQGGTGYLKTSGPNVKFRDRVATWAASPIPPDAVIIAGGINDAGTFTPAQVQAEALLLFTQIRGLFPSVPIFVLGAWAGSTGPSANVIAIENAVSAAVTQFGDSKTAFIPVSTASQAWIYGTGRSGATNSSGNSDFYIGGVDGSDATHPTPNGHDYIASRVLRGVRGALASISASGG
jgi:lysophospholipase L1-like esterase